jgi:hypothetical protein
MVYDMSIATAEAYVGIAETFIGAVALLSCLVSTIF